MMDCTALSGDPRITLKRIVTSAMSTRFEIYVGSYLWYTSLESIFHADFKYIIHFDELLAIEESRTFEIFCENLFFETK